MPINRAWLFWLALLLFYLHPAFTATSLAAPKAELWPVWQTHAKHASVEVDHSAWGRFLKSHVHTAKNGVNLVRYDAVTAQERRNLHAYLAYLQQIGVHQLTRAQQLAYWINFYNAGTVLTVLKHYPVDSILDIDTSPGLFSNGPWGKKQFRVASHELSLDDIEHRILRPIWKDPLLHYTLNCASYGCPNLQLEAFSARNSRKLATQAAYDYINHPRGVTIIDQQITVSSIYHWFKDDFGGSDQAIIAHILHYAAPDLKKKITQINRIDGHQYDWSLNDKNGR